MPHRLNFIPVTEPNPTSSLGWVKVSQLTDIEIFDYSNNNNDDDDNNNNNNIDYYYYYYYYYYYCYYYYYYYYSSLFTC